MHGLSSPTDLRFFQGREVERIGVGQFQASVHFDGDLTLTIEGQCRLDRVECAPGAGAGKHLLAVLGLVVASASCVDERHLALRFDNGTELLVLEDDDPFESFNITGPAIHIVV